MLARIRKKGQSILVSIWVSSFCQLSQEQLEIFICIAHNESKHCGTENKDKKKLNKHGFALRERKTHCTHTPNTIPF